MEKYKEDNQSTGTMNEYRQKKANVVTYDKG